MTTRVPSPGPSFVREEPLRLRGAAGSGSGQAQGALVRLGMSAPSVLDDGWWLSHLWVEDDEGVVPALLIAPRAGPPPGAPLMILGPSLAGALGGLLGQEGGRQLIRLRMPPAEDEARPWERPLMLWVALMWDPVRASTMRRNELARELLRAFRGAVLAAGSPA
jgi:hypothetical protein